LVQLGLDGLRDPQRADEAFARLELAFSDQALPSPVPIHSSQGMVLASLIGRFRVERKQFETAERFFRMAATSKNGGYCQRMQHGTLVTPYPASSAEAERILVRYHRELDALLSIDGPIEVRGMDKDDYVFCMMTAFDHSFYYASDWRATLGKYCRVARKAFPHLAYVAPHLRSADTAGECGTRIRLGVASAFFRGDSSVLADFKGVLRRLPRAIFDVTLIRLEGEARSGVGAPFVAHPADRTLVINVKEPTWLERARAEIGMLELDLLLYLDLTMSPMAHRLAMSRLARVQAVSHGHPVTSGIERPTMNFFISWAAAELPTAHEHYTEELALLPAQSMHQYYEPRVTADGASVVDGEKFRHLTRRDFASMGLPAASHWYLCMQKPFKRQPEFDSMLADILRKDAAAHLLLHDTETPESHQLIVARMKRAGCDMSRVHLLPSQPHHRLLALYALSDVTLDSYPASGCTTTREALEVGALVVTLPAKYLGSRWSLAYYSIIGVLDMVAMDETDYTRIAVRVATDGAVRGELKRRVAANLHKLFRSEDAVRSWTSVLSRLARGKEGQSEVAPTRGEAGVALEDPEEAEALQQHQQQAEETGDGAGGAAAGGGASLPSLPREVMRETPRATHGSGRHGGWRMRPA
jgi:hypothetical protein